MLMTTVLIGMGSNIEPEENLLRAAQALRSEFGNVRFSTVYRSKAVGMDGEDFYNACCVFQSALSQQDVRRHMKALEDAQGRDRSRGSWKPRTLDLDVLMYDDEVIDDELYQYAHASVPASELVVIESPKSPAGQSLTVVDLHL